ncbi:MAG TPA: sugar phosphate isomerase/epimerase [Smithella sp.]|nr:sugar phosphate isomerase/epimerase [Smithella sp.]
MITIGTRAHNIEEIIAASKFGCPTLEISLDDPAIVSKWLPQLLDIKNSCGISFLAHYPNEDNPVDVEILRDKFLPRIKSLMVLSRRLDINKATIHFWLDKRRAPEDLIRGKIELLSRIVAYGADFGITVCIENLTERSDSFTQAFEAIPGLRMTLDIGHAQLLARQNTSFGFIEDCFPKIAHVHVHDNFGGTNVKDDLHLALGEGSVDYKAIIQSLVNKGYDSTITMEVKPKDIAKTKQTLEDCIREAQNRGRQISSE